MSSLITSSEIATITGIFSDIFDTRSRSIVVHKAPLKVAVSSYDSNLVFGFGENQQTDAFTYLPVSGVYPAVIIYDKGDTVSNNSEIMSRISNLGVKIKVREDCRNYINTGPTDKFTFDDRTFYSNGEEVEINGQFWLFDLVATK